MTTDDDDYVSVQRENLTDEEIGHAGVKDITEITDYRIRQDGDCTIHTIKFGAGSSLSIAYAGDAKVLKVEVEGVRFERLGESLFVMKAVRDAT